MRLISAVFLLVLCNIAPAQEISFSHLNTTHGLSDNLVTTVARDKDGLLWVGTAEGLNSYDGYTVKKYYKEDYPAMGTNHIVGLLCDDQNRIWLRNTLGSIAVIDEKRNFIPVTVIENGVNVPIHFIRKTKSRGIVLFSKNKLYVQKKNKDLAFEKINWVEDPALNHRFGQIVSDENDKLLLAGNNRVCVFDAARLKVLYNLYIPNLIGAAWLSKDELLVTTDKNQELLRVNLPQDRIVENYGTLKDQYGEPVKGYLRNIRQMKDGRYIITSGYGGVYIFDATATKLYRYHHDPLNNSSVSANNTFIVQSDSSGYVYITTRSTGLNYFNTNYHLASYRSAFQETATGNIFHGFVNKITKHKDGHLWLGTQSGLMEWNRELNKTWFHDYGIIKGQSISGIEEVRALCFDNNDKLWVGLNRYGIVVLDKSRKVVKYMNTDSLNSRNYLPGNWINHITMDPGNKLWVSTARGLCIINPGNYEVINLSGYGELKKLSKTHCYSTWFRNPGEIWIGTNKGAYRYRKAINELTLFNKANGLSNNNAVCFAEDKNGNIYIGTSEGLNIIRDDRVVKIYNRTNGLKNDRCLGLLSDNDNNIWIGNDNVLLSYNTMDSSFSLYDESLGLSPSGYRMLSFYQADDGEQFWGSDIGLSYFFPRELKDLKLPIQVNINSFFAGNEKVGFSAHEKIKLPYSKNNLAFGFSASDLLSSKNIRYEYKLDGADDEWKKSTLPQQVTYSNLPSGNYSFIVKASKDGINWTQASNPVTILIQTPWWKSYGFMFVCLFTVAGTILYFIKSRSRKIQEQKEQLETEQAINYFATSMNRHRTIDDTLWDVTRNCIGRLGFEDCVIYLKDEKKDVLVQKAAWGPKTTHENKILNPIEIQVGTGIVGYVAKTGEPLIINDTSKDERYIVDDEKRLAEITVPIISDGNILGVIDSENSRKNFFNNKHLSILTTIASLCANMIVRAKALEDKQTAEKNLLNTQRQTAEMEMQALRAQMNPHFMFNSLNSINNFILKNDPDNASQYLTRFSRLMRLILDNSREEWVLLENELKSLQLYIEMEAIRFDNVFEYEIQISPEVNPSSVTVPPMIIQPYVENAIWHGLLHRKEPGSKLEIKIWKLQETLCIQIEDNGVGRRKAAMLNGKFSSHKKSHGMQITAKRLEMVNKVYNVDANVQIDDKVDKSGNECGTSVLLRLHYSLTHSV